MEAAIKSESVMPPNTMASGEVPLPKIGAPKVKVLSLSLLDSH